MAVWGAFCRLFKLPEPGRRKIPVTDENPEFLEPKFEPVFKLQDHFACRIGRNFHGQGTNVSPHHAPYGAAKIMVKLPSLPVGSSCSVFQLAKTGALFDDPLVPVRIYAPALVPPDDHWVRSSRSLGLFVAGLGFCFREHSFQRHHRHQDAFANPDRGDFAPPRGLVG